MCDDISQIRESDIADGVLIGSIGSISPELDQEDLSSLSVEHAFGLINPNSVASVSAYDLNISLPSVEPSFTGSLLIDAPSPSQTIIQDSAPAADQFSRSPQIATPDTPPLPEQGLQDDSLELEDLFEQEVDEDLSRNENEIEQYEDDVENEELQYEDESEDGVLQYGDGIAEDPEDVSLDSSPLMKKSTSLPPIEETPRPLSSVSIKQRPPLADRRRNVDLSETVVTSRVKDLAVSDSAVKNFAIKRSLPPNQAPSMNTPQVVSKASLNATGSALTLKEQSALIDKLQKDNWGYQLKIYILQEELDKRSEDSVRDLRNENIEFKSINVGLNIDIKKLNKKIAELEARLRSAETQREHQQQQRSEAAEVESQGLEDEIESLRDELENCLSTINKLNAELENTRLLADELKIREQEYRQDLDEMERRELRYKNKLASLEKATTAEDLLEGEVATLREFLQREQEAREMAQKEVLDLRTELLHVRRSTSTVGDREAANQISKLRQESRDLRRELVMQTNLAESGNLEKERVYRELEDFRRLHVRSSSSATSRRSIVTSSEDHGGIVSDLCEKVSEVKFVARERKMQVDLLNKENSDLQDVIENLQGTIQNLADDKTSLEADVAQLLKETAAREEEIITWQEDYEVLSTEADAELTRLSDLVKAKEAEFLKLQTEIDSFTRLMSAFNKESEDLKYTVNNYEDQISKQNATIEDLQTQLAKSKADVAAQLKASKEESARERSRWNELTRRAQDSEAAAQDLRKQLEEANRLVGGRKQFDQQIEEYESAMQELERHLENLQQEHMDRSDAKAEWTRKATEYDAKVSTLEKRLAEAQERNTALQQAKLNFSNTVSAKGSVNGAGELNGSMGGSLYSGSSEKWMIRLQELEQRLKAEREARIRDRDGARQRLDEALKENDELRNSLAKTRSRNGGTFGTLLSGAFVRSFVPPTEDQNQGRSTRQRQVSNDIDSVDDEVDSR
ncbi:hypothetical protein V1512DRAFT_262859 [Lipomyces arxii]|uniref:uncharacterized protein n=1 Tax=Lipomyces arxii TaxID=56418 RepID=UPI0034CD3C30